MFRGIETVKTVKVNARGVETVKFRSPQLEEEEEEGRVSFLLPQNVKHLEVDVFDVEDED